MTNMQTPQFVQFHPRRARAANDSLVQRGRVLPLLTLAFAIAIAPACGDDGGEGSDSDGSADGDAQDGAGDGDDGAQDGSGDGDGGADGDGSDADGSSTDDGDADGEGTGGITELEASCQAYCEAQGVLACPDDFPPAQCTSLCIDLPDNFGGCTDAWIDLNWCMADAPLFCENGTASVRYADCPTQLDAFDACVESL